MKTVAVLVLTASTLLGSGTASAEGRTVPSHQATVVDFVSIGSGIDSFRYSRAVAIIGEAVKDGKVAEFAEKRWGREGERSLCVLAHEREDGQSLADALTILVVESPALPHLMFVRSVPNCQELSR